MNCYWLVYDLVVTDAFETCRAFQRNRPVVVASFDGAVVSHNFYFIFKIVVFSNFWLFPAEMFFLGEGGGARTLSEMLRSLLLCFVCLMFDCVLPGLIRVFISAQDLLIQTVCRFRY